MTHGQYTNQDPIYGNLYILTCSTCFGGEGGVIQIFSVDNQYIRKFIYILPLTKISTMSLYCSFGLNVTQYQFLPQRLLYCKFDLGVADCPNSPFLILFPVMFVFFFFFFLVVHVVHHQFPYYSSLLQLRYLSPGSVLPVSKLSIISRMRHGPL